MLHSSCRDQIGGSDDCEFRSFEADQENITCMDGSGCPAPFPEIELSRLLSAKSFDLYHRLKLASELATANIEGLETCPTCDYAVVIDNPDEKLFVCQHVGCKQISCRKCRRKVSPDVSFSRILMSRSTFRSHVKVIFEQTHDGSG